VGINNISRFMHIHEQKKRYGFMESKQKRDGLVHYVEVQTSLVTADNIIAIIRGDLSAMIVERRLMIR
jgi:hypothetical protein